MTAGKFSKMVTHQKSLKSVNETKAMATYQHKKVLCMGFAVGNCSMEEKYILQNVHFDMYFFFSPNDCCQYQNLLRYLIIAPFFQAFTAYRR